MSKPIVLVVDDEAGVRESVRMVLKDAFEPVALENGDAAADWLAENRAALMFLDILMPGTDGLETLEKVRARAPEMPVVMLTARGEVMDRVVGLELGADDYLPKPFEPRELVARLQTILRRHHRAAAARGAAAPASRREFEGLSIDLDKREVLRQGERVDLTGTEFELLALLASEPGKVFGRDDILNRLRGHEAELYSRAVDIVISRLRRKLEPLDCIKTLRNAGYALAVGKSGAA